MPGHKFGCVQTAHMYVYKYMLNPACHKLGCIQLHMYMCVKHNHFVSAEVTVGRRCDT